MQSDFSLPFTRESYDQFCEEVFFNSLGLEVYTFVWLNNLSQSLQVKYFVQIPHFLLLLGTTIPMSNCFFQVTACLGNNFSPSNNLKVIFYPSFYLHRYGF